MFDRRNSAEVKGYAAKVRGARITGIQNRVYTGLLIFVVLMGAPLLAIPSVRNRLYTRVHSVYKAFGPLSLDLPPARAKVGENRYPVPVEFERPVISRPESPRLIVMPNTVIRLGGDVAVGGSKRTGAKSETPREPESGEPSEPVFGQGKAEQEAYDLLVKSNEAVSGLVKGSNAGLRFKTWSAAKVDDETFWVKLTFAQASDNAEVQYVWGVKPSSKEITPLSRNARALSSR